MPLVMPLKNTKPAGAAVPSVAAHDENTRKFGRLVSDAGGVICASVEYHGVTQTPAFAVIEEKAECGDKTRQQP